VWDMVAFLKALPDMDAAAYSGIVADDCTGCHGVNGEGGVTGIPRLDIQTPHYLAMALKAFRDGTRESGTMTAAAAQLSDDQIDELAALYGRGVVVPTGASSAEAAVIVQNGIPERDVPACDSCHGANAKPGYPKLDGQDADYLLSQLELFKLLEQERGGPNGQIMAEVVRFLESDEMVALAEWYGAGTVSRTPRDLPRHP